MKSPVESIDSVLISEEDITRKLPSIFVDAIVVDQRFNIVAVSQNVLDFLEFTNLELKGKNINYLSGDKDLAAALKQELQTGIVEEKTVSFFNKGNCEMRIGISGFYLGLISDINGYIILKIKNLEAVELISSKLEQKKAELDKFIYRTAHDLRGPLATIKGLVNLVKMRQNNDELEHLIQLIDSHANKLDERLFQMVYLAQADTEHHDYAQNRTTFKEIEIKLRRILKQNGCTDFIKLHYSAPMGKLKGIDETLTTSMFNNMLLFIVSLPMSGLQNQIYFRIIHEGDFLKITIGVKGFSLNQNLRSAIHQNDFIYTDMVHYPQLINFYAAQKIAWRLNGRMSFTFIAEEIQRINITLPLNKITQLPLF